VGIGSINLAESKEALLEETTIREPEQICQGCTKKLLKVVRGPKLRAVLGYFVREVWTTPWIADLRLTSEGGIVARIEGEKDFRVDLGGRKGLIRSVHSIATKAALDGDELGYLVAQVAKIKREELL